MSYELLEERRESAGERLADLRKRVARESSVTRQSDFCIYVTGSYGRLEASEFSDLDLFFVELGRDGRPIRNIQKTLIDADLIRLTRALGFPEFSGDGEYLVVHQLPEMLSVLGSPEDDYRNYFTARMLLLLESRPVYGDGAYQSAVERIVESYYRDYHDHEDDFLPVFLVNDIIRFWKTLCLNYEHKRNRQEARGKEKVHLKNFKLKFSRCMTCFSGVIALCDKGGKLKPEEVVALVRLSPTERLERIRDVSKRAGELVEKLLEYYEWFLDVTGKSDEDAHAWIGDRVQRDAAFNRGRSFGGAMHNLVTEVSGANGLTRYLVV